MNYHLAQVNIARALAPMDDPIMQGFVERLDEINALAEGSPGFVWRLQDESGDATSIQVWEDDLLLINMSVWESIEQLKEFTYRTVHAELMRQRKKWFEHFGQAYMVMWWIPAGHIPDLQEAKVRLEQIQQAGASQEAFDFRSLYPAPNS